MSREQVFYNLYKTATVLIVLTTPARIPRTNWINCKWHLAGISFRNLFSTILQRPQSMEAYDLCWGWFWKVFPGIEARSKNCNPSFKTDLVLDLCELEPFSTTTYFFSFRRKVLILLRAFPPLLAFVSWCRLLETSPSRSTILIPLCWDRGGLLSSAALLLLRPWLTQRLLAGAVSRNTEHKFDYSRKSTKNARKSTQRCARFTCIDCIHTVYRLYRLRRLHRL